MLSGLCGCVWKQGGQDKEEPRLCWEFAGWNASETLAC